VIQHHVADHKKAAPRDLPKQGGEILHADLSVAVPLAGGGPEPGPFANGKDRRLYRNSQS
jgi:hypothetical protein